ncbi:unnamed protein product [Sphagnum jensenii]|uniref:Uncharacterized protein n=1 Tax=Sphagnum jensenii TaxID=128206 RepID=A0ABP1BRE5_9BRYO
MRRRRTIHFFPILVDEEHLHLHFDEIFVVRLPSVPLFRLMILLGAMAAASQLGCSNMHWDSKSLLPFVFKQPEVSAETKMAECHASAPPPPPPPPHVQQRRLGPASLSDLGKVFAHEDLRGTQLSSTSLDHWYHVVPHEEEPLMTFTHIARFCDSISQYLDVRKLKICLAWLLHPHQSQST